MDKECIKTKIESRILNYLEKPELTALELKYLSEAYSELDKNEWMQEFIKHSTYLDYGFGGSANLNSISAD